MVLDPASVVVVSVAASLQLARAAQVVSSVAAAILAGVACCMGRSMGCGRQLDGTGPGTPCPEKTRHRSQSPDADRYKLESVDCRVPNESRKSERSRWTRGPTLPAPRWGCQCIEAFAHHS